jgi:hypothetical protein
VERLRNSQPRCPETAAAPPPLPAAVPMAEISFDPVHVLGCSPEKAQRLFHGRPVTPGEAEAIAERSYPYLLRDELRLQLRISGRGRS